MSRPTLTIPLQSYDWQPAGINRKLLAICRQQRISALAQGHEYPSAYQAQL